jgi:hypothetical protein
MDDLTRELEKAVWHVAKATEIITRQLELVHALRGTSYAAWTTENTPDILIRMLRSLKDHEGQLREVIERGDERRSKLLA